MRRTSMKKDLGWFTLHERCLVGYQTDIYMCIMRSIHKIHGHTLPPGGTVAEWVRALAWTGDRTVPARFESNYGKPRFGTLAIPFTPLRQCLSEETLKAVGSFYLVSTAMPGEVKEPTSPHWNV